MEISLKAKPRPIFTSKGNFLPFFAKTPLDYGRGESEEAVMIMNIMNRHLLVNENNSTTFRDFLAIFSPEKDYKKGMQYVDDFNFLI